MKIEINTIGTKVEHRAALAELKALMSAYPGLTRAERAKMEVLALLIETYEEKHFPIPRRQIRWRPFFSAWISKGLPARTWSRSWGPRARSPRSSPASVR